MSTRGVLDNAIFQAILRVALFENSYLKLTKGLFRNDRAVEMCWVRVQRLGYRDRRRCKAGPVKSRRSAHDAVEILRITLRLHHRLTATARAAQEIAMGRLGAIVAAEQSLGHFCRPV